MTFDELKIIASVLHDGQVRKYTQEPYVVHCISVAETVLSVNKSPLVVAAAMLHDVVEDVSLDRIIDVAMVHSTVPHIFQAKAEDYIMGFAPDCRTNRLSCLSQWLGATVASLVEQVSDVSDHSMGNRAARKEIDRLHLSVASAEAKTIKLADLIDNTRSIVEHDAKFARVYMHEKQLLLPVLQGGDPTLYRQAKELIDQYYLENPI